MFCSPVVREVSQISFCSCDLGNTDLGCMRAFPFFITASSAKHLSKNFLFFLEERVKKNLCFDGRSLKQDVIGTNAMDIGVVGGSVFERQKRMLFFL